jgi:hypothetical protein
MHRSRAIHFLTVLALAIPATAIAWASGGPAAAVAAPTCASVIGPNGVKWTLSKCTDPTHTGSKGTASAKFATGGTGTMKITWNKTGTTTLSFTYSIVPVSLCPTSEIEVREIGKVTGGTGAALKTIKKGQKTTVTVCQSPKSGVSLVKGTKFVL